MEIKKIQNQCLDAAWSQLLEISESLEKLRHEKNEFQVESQIFDLHKKAQYLNDVLMSFHGRAHMVNSGLRHNCAADIFDQIFSRDFPNVSRD